MLSFMNWRKHAQTLFMGQLHPDYRRAWQQVYRALAHETARGKCKQTEMMDKFPSSIQDFANHFVKCQEMRHQCDYDPLSETTLSTVSAAISSTKEIIPDFKASSEQDIRAFCCFVLLPKREDPLREAIEKERNAAKKRAEQEAAAEVKRAERAAGRAEREASR